MELRVGKLYCAHKVMRYNNRPVLCVEIMGKTDDTVTFDTDYPVYTITIPKDEFIKNFSRR